MASIALLAVFAWQRQAQAATTLNVTAGFGSGTVAANAYGPGAPTIVVGDSIKWTVGSDEVHSVTFGSNPGGGPPANWPVAGFTAPPPGPPGPVSLGPVTYTGTEFLNTGLMSKGSTATVTFNTAGTFNYFCVIHSGMTGVVNVVASGSATTQAQADSAAASTSSLLLGQVSALRQSTLNSAVGVAQPDGTTRWDIWANGVNPPAAMPGGGTGYLELLEFIPPNLAIKAGDTVHWRATAPHTVTFLAPGQDVDALEAQYGGPTGVPAAKPSSSYDGKSFYNSGPLTLGPTAPKDFSLTFPTQGTFQYLCLFHEESGQIGYITVGASATRLPSTGGAPIQTGSGGSSVPWLVLLAGAGALAIAMGAGGLAFCKVKR
ncbi:MAG TPA: plastocyanin/azurin family copper-binding protein [Dehalococcoidia bacterium]|nr:plastocyanin/azurin family copper-binding protein [Dehalococcoidia bacterium]